MPVPRRKQFDPSNPPWVHCISRCVRRAFLAGQDHDGRDVERRKRWIESRLRLLAQAAACEVSSYSCMSNHLHVVLRILPKQAQTWTVWEVVRRWLMIWPKERGVDGRPVEPRPEVMDDLVANTAQVEIWRERLADLGWIMKALKEDIAKRANKEDGCSGAFWEGRFKSVPLLDQQALLACMAYVDLNPIRAKIADRPERSRYTGAYERIRVRKTLRAAARLRRAGQGEQATQILREAGVDARLSDADKGSWLTPIACCHIEGRPLSLNEYLTLLDTTGRVLVSGKRGGIPPELAPILQRLDRDLENWLTCMFGFRQFLGAAVGRLASRALEAGRRGLKWMQNRCGLFAGETVAERG